jgi:hypothetical protein
MTDPSSPPEIDRAVFDLAVDAVDAELSVVSFRGVERMSRPYAFEVRVVTGVTVPLVLQQRTQSRLNAANAALQQQSAENARLAAELARQSNQLAQVARSAPAPSSPDTEVLRLRGEVGKLRTTAQEIAASKTNGPSTLSGITSNPEMFKMIRTQQKAGMSMIYRDLTNRISLSPDQVGKLNETPLGELRDDLRRLGLERS